MEAKRNYQQEMEQELATLSGVPKLLLHSCCAPCSSYVLETLSAYFEMLLLYYNPNIMPEAEYQHRLAEQKRLVEAMPLQHPVTLLEGDYTPAAYAAAIRGVEHTPEGGLRCQRCIAFRLEEAADYADRLDCDYFATTLTISPHKDASFINAYGMALAQRHHAAFLPSDFKKRGGYQRSLQLSKAYGLYRQDFCGCAISAREAEARRCKKENPQ